MRLSLFIFLVCLSLNGQESPEESALKPGAELKYNFTFLPEVVARYNGVEMSSIELLKLMGSRLSKLKNKLLNQRELKYFVIDFLQDHYKRQASLKLAAEAGFDLNMGLATLRLEAMEAKQGKRKVIEQFEDTGLLYSTAPRFLAETYALNEWLEKKILLENKVDEASALYYYSENKQLFTQQEKVLFAQVYIGFITELEKPSALKRIRNAAESIQLGQEFALVAKKNSEGKEAINGGLFEHLFTKVQLRPELHLLFKMKANQVSGIIETNEGFHIVKLLKKTKAGLSPFKRIRKGLMQQLSKEKAFKVMSDLIVQKKIDSGFRIYIK